MIDQLAKPKKHPIQIADEGERYRRGIGIQRTWADENLVVMGWIVAGLYLLSFISPPPAVAVERLGYLATGAIFLLFTALRRTVKIHFVVPAAFALMLQIWNFLTALYAHQHLARPITLGRAEFYIIESMVPFFTVATLCTIDERQRQNGINMLLAVLAVSCLFAWVQFSRFQPALRFAQVYTYKPIDYWDGKPGIRAVGLTNHPHTMCIEAILGFVLVGYQAIWRKLTNLEIFAVLYFCGAAVAAQGRTGLVCLAILWLIFFCVLVKNDPKLAGYFVGAIFLAGCAVLILASKRLGYLLQNQSTAKTEDSSLAFRELLWQAQMSPVFPKLAWTGIGPSEGILLGTGPEDKWVPIGTIMECAYRMFLVLNGIPGLILYCLTMITGTWISAICVFKKSFPPALRQAAAAGFAMGVIFLVSSNSSDMVDGYTAPQLAWFVCGLATPSVVILQEARLRRIQERYQRKVEKVKKTVRFAA
jgi:hypothetical protein